jgi:hypothetical protein
MAANKQFKNSVFSFLFSNLDNLRELYSAIKGIPLPQDIHVDINTLSDILYMEQINDLSFTVDDRLIVLIEHQSTINPNMPLRLLSYITQAYKTIINRRKLYQSNLEKIPEPEFIVLYNGKEDYPDYSELKLSDAFMEIAGFRGSKSTALELVVQVYNINHGRNPEILKKSHTLDGYSVFVERVREYEKAFPFEEAFGKAIKYCIEHNILKQFMERHGSEVYNMLGVWGWDAEEQREALREEALEQGLAQGIEQGMAQGIEQGMAQGIERGIEKGIERGMAQGIERGMEKGIERGMERGMEQGIVATARNALNEGFSLDVVQKITGLDIDAIKEIQAQMNLR